MRDVPAVPIKRHLDAYHEDITPAERKILAELDTGVLTVLGDGTVPATPTPETRVRAGFLRILILAEGMVEYQGQSLPLHETGLQILGAYIESDGDANAVTQGLTFEGAALPADVVLV